MPKTLVYYCSGHGFGHATRVSALASHLLRLPGPARPVIYIVSSAPQHVFTDAVSLGAHYRSAFIDPVIVQPLAYCVDRQRSVDGLKAFMEREAEMAEREVRWLNAVGAHCVLSDAAYLGCLAATQAGLPSILVTNFTFDSVYSFLSTTITEAPMTTSDETHPATEHLRALESDTPIPREELEPLVQRIHRGYRCADLLLRLPGYIPIPSFAMEPKLPSSDWVDPASNQFREEILASLDHNSSTLYPSVPSTSTKPARQVLDAPLLVRAPSESIYTSSGRANFLNSIGIPEHLHNSKILVVSFGGQIFRRPHSRAGTPSHSRQASRDLTPEPPHAHHLRLEIPPPTPDHDHGDHVFSSPRVATESHLDESDVTRGAGVQSPEDDQVDEEQSAFLLPDDSWIAVVCGVSKDQWNAENAADSLLPDGFYIAPRDVYMPDLTAVGDVLLGKLGYGTVSECVDSSTPFVYVSRPLFIEEHGLRRLLEQQGVGIELMRESYEAGDWAGAIGEAYRRGSRAKSSRRLDGLEGVQRRKQEGRRMAEQIIQWIR
ncbi:unnamed protein product [Mycena citricolor]|uniref:L-arabinokinase n=1 Tax=Mycena citricolor TaxID=2018698 RepID=A0AAD2H3T5_9AGAR|nr:unnamed protein product [Mycena citricolor]